MTRQAWFLLTISLLLSGCFFYAGSVTFSAPGEHRRAAEKLQGAGKYREALQEYELHMAERLKARNRPAEENPYFYLLYVGDCYLELGEEKTALAKYLEAREHGIPDTSLTDRLLRVANWYGARGRYEEALALLEKYREVDPLILESQLDTFSKLIVQRDEGMHHGPQPTPRTNAR